MQPCLLHVHSDKTEVPFIRTVAHLVQFETTLCHGDWFLVGWTWWFSPLRGLVRAPCLHWCIICLSNKATNYIMSDRVQPLGWLGNISLHWTSFRGGLLGPICPSLVIGKINNSFVQHLMAWRHPGHSGAPWDLGVRWNVSRIKPSFYFPLFLSGRINKMLRCLFTSARAEQRDAVPASVERRHGSARRRRQPISGLVSLQHLGGSERRARSRAQAAGRTAARIMVLWRGSRRQVITIW